MKLAFKYTLIASAITLLAACGGSGDGEVAVGNQRPVANAGTNLNVLTGQVVTLDGTKSNDPENQPITYKWVLLQKPAGGAYFDETQTATPFLSDTRAGTYVAQLIVSDGEQDSEPATVTIEVSATTIAPPRAPTASEIGRMKDLILEVFPTYLRSPSSFKLIETPSWTYPTNNNLSNGVFRFDFDAANGFGAILRGKASCYVEWDTRGYWKNTMENDLKICVII